MKKCSRCEISKPLAEYPKQKACKDGYAYMCKDCFREYRIKNKEFISASQREYYLNNKDRLRATMKEYVSANQSSIRIYNRKYHYRYNKDNIEVKRWRALLSNTLKRLNTSKRTSTHNLLGYSAKQLKDHLDSLGMDWEHHQIDHKIPISWFRECTPPSVVNDLRNLQPTTIKENTSKGNKYMDKVPEEYAKKVIPFIKEEYLNLF